MKKTILSLSLIFSFGLYAVFNQPASGAVRTDTPTTMNDAPSVKTQSAPSGSNTIAAAPPRYTNREGEYEDDDEGGYGRVVSSTAPAPIAVATVTPKPAPTPKPTVVSSPTPITKPKGQYADGTYTGTPADAYYGTVQVQATVSGGKLINVKFLSYPSDRRTSQQINSYAMSALTQEAIQAQSANVSTVSGASDTSAAFRQSLGDALAQAKA